MISSSALPASAVQDPAPPWDPPAAGDGIMQTFQDWLPAGGMEATELVPLLWRLVAALLLGQVLAWHYVRYAQVLANKRRFARLFPLIAGTTLLMISVVKISLALSLGLVGALSIIRFRTPIKEPEELAYLFLAIALGVGFGAEQSLTTFGAFVVLLIFISLRAGWTGRDTGMASILQVTTPFEAGAPTRDALEKLLDTLRPKCQHLDLRRADLVGGELHVSLMVEAASSKEVSGLLDAARQTFPEASVSLVDRGGLD